MRVGNVENGCIDTKLDSISKAIIESEICGVLRFPWKGRLLKPVVLIKELEVELSLFGGVGIVSVEGYLSVHVRCRQEEKSENDNNPVESARPHRVQEMSVRSFNARGFARLLQVTPGFQRSSRISRRWFVVVNNSLSIVLVWVKLNGQ